MNEFLSILLAGLIVMAVLAPLAEAYSKWKKEMECDEHVDDR